MEAKTIDLLSSLLPDADGSLSSLGARAYNLPKAARNKAAKRFQDKYRNVAFGWHAASALAQSRKRFPMPLYGRDLWVWKAYLYISDSNRWYDAHISEAYGLNDKSNSKTAGIVKSLLLLPDTSFKEIADITGMHRATIEAYETLFYNVKDRVGERIYIGQTVYPDYKVVEFRPDYFDNVSVEDLLIRTGYASQDRKTVLHAAGMGTNDFLNKLAADPNNEKMLDNHMMATGIILQSMNLGSQNLVGLTNARQMMMSKHASGVSASSSGVTFEGTSMYTDWRSANEKFRQMQIMAEKARNVIDVKEVTEEVSETSNS